MREPRRFVPAIASSSFEEIGRDGESGGELLRETGVERAEAQDARVGLAEIDGIETCG